MLAGNHDHGLAAGWIDARLQTEPAGFLGLEQRFDAGTRPARASSSPRPRGPRGCSSPTPASGCATTSTRSTATTPTCTPPSRPSSGSPRARWRKWVATLPRRSARRPTTTRPSSRRSTPGCTRSRSAPTTSLVTQRRRRLRRARTAPLTAAARPRALALETGYRGAVAALNLAGLGPLQASLSPSALRRGYLHGHPRGDRAPRHRRARTSSGATRTAPARGRATTPPSGRATGARILNTGSWVYQPHFLTPEPERLALLAGHRGARRRRPARRGSVRLLGDRGHEDLRPRPG